MFVLYAFIYICSDVYVVIFKCNVIIDEIKTMVVTIHFNLFPFDYYMYV
jgi:hypothetical protein